MKRLVTLILAAALSGIAAGPPAAAHTLGKNRAVEAARAEAQKLARKTAGRQPRVKSCKRRTKHRWACVVSVAYPKDRAVCRVPVTISYRKTGHQGHALQRRVGATICF